MITERLENALRSRIYYCGVSLKRNYAEVQTSRQNRLEPITKITPDMLLSCVQEFQLRIKKCNEM